MLRELLAFISCCTRTLSCIGHNLVVTSTLVGMDEGDVAVVRPNKVRSSEGCVPYLWNSGLA